MATSEGFCYPPFHATFAPLAVGPQTTVFSGCAVNAQGNVACAPEAMRANAEAQLRRLAPGLFSGSLSLDAYTLARYMQSEVGDHTIEERVAVGEAAVNQAKRRGKSILNVLLYNQGPGHPNYGFYGPIHGPEGVSTAPYQRWASTSRDPTTLTLLLANLVMTGRSNNFARGALDQWGPEAWVKDGQTRLTNFVKSLTQSNLYWVGPLPGVDHWRTFLVTQENPGVSTGAALAQRGLTALTLPAQRPIWPANLPICVGGLPAVDDGASDGTFTKFALGFAAIAGLFGLGWLSLRAAKHFATGAPFFSGVDED